MATALLSRGFRLGIYCPGAGTGGPWRYVHSLLNGIDLEQFEVTVFCNLNGDYERRPDVRIVNLDAAAVNGTLPPAERPSSKGDRSLPARRRLMRLVPVAVRLWSGFGRDAVRLARLVRPYGLDLLHTQNTGCEESPLAARLAGVPHVLGTFHVDSTVDVHRERSGATHRLLEHLSNHCLDVGIAVSRATKRDWVRRTHIPAARVTTIHNGIDPNHFCRRRSKTDARRQLGLPADALVIGGVGRLDEAKGFEYLLTAAARLRSDFPTLLVAIAGDGPLRKSLERLAGELGIVDIVRFLGFQTDIQVVLEALDVFTLPSLSETLGYALLEAMSMELAAVGSTVGGIPEVIVQGKTGLLVPPRNPDRLADGLRTLLKDNDLRARMGTAGRERIVRDFHERDMVSKTIDLYRSACRWQRHQ